MNLEEMFYGSYEMKLDSKARCSFPSQYRKICGSGVYAKINGKVILRPKEYYESRASQLLIEGDVEAKLKFFSELTNLELDGQGRVFLPRKILDYLCCTKGESVVFKGAGDVIVLEKAEGSKPNT